MSQKADKQVGSATNNWLNLKARMYGKYNRCAWCVYRKGADFSHNNTIVDAVDAVDSG